MSTNSPTRKGGALLAVLWLSAALSAIAFTVANTVRAEIERTATTADGLRAYYIATGAVERALLYMSYGGGPRNPDGSPRYWDPAKPALHFAFPGGDALVEVIPEGSKLNLNLAKPEEFFRVLLALGVDPDRAEQIAMAIVDWRAAVPPGEISPFDQDYLSRSPSFRARHASFEETEEALLVKGMTPDLFYGAYTRDPQGHLVPRGGFRDCVSVYGWGNPVDVNTAPPALLLSLGLTPETVAVIVQMRRVAPFRTMAQLQPILDAAGPVGQRLALGVYHTIYTLRATARPRVADGKLSDLARSVSAIVKLLRPGSYPPYQVLRWYDDAPSPDGHFR